MNIPSGTLVRVINKYKSNYNKTLIVEFSDCFKQYVCCDLRGYRLTIDYNYDDLEILSFYNNEPFPNCNCKNAICYFCYNENKFLYICNNYIYYCPKCLR